MPRTALTFPRYLAPRVREALRDSPAVLIHGPHQSGKTTHARAVGEPRGYRYLSFDDAAICAAARGAPIGFVSALPAKTILDEVQRTSPTASPPAGIRRPWRGECPADGEPGIGTTSRPRSSGTSVT